MLYSSLVTRIPTSPILAYITLVLPLLLSMTIFADNPALLILLLLIPAGLILLVPRKQLGTPLPSPNPMFPNSRPPNPSPSAPANIHSLPLLPSLTVYRAHMLLMTILAILAVDFPVFPRYLAKCETFGVSLVFYSVLCTPRVHLNSAWFVKDGPRSRVFCLFSRDRLCNSFPQGSFPSFDTRTA